MCRPIYILQILHWPLCSFIAEADLSHIETRFYKINQTTETLHRF
jgi:hypothetical protein